MIKKFFAVVMMLVLITTIVAGCAPANNNNGDGEGAEEYRIFEDSTLGIRLRWPDVWYEALYESLSILPVGSDSGIIFYYITPAGLSAMQALYIDPDLPDDSNTLSQEQLELVETMNNNLFPLCALVAENDGVRDEAAHSELISERKLGESEGTNYYLLTSPGADLSALSAQEKGQYQALLAATDEFDKELVLSGMQSMFKGEKFEFDSKTIDGEKIDSSVFADYSITMINIWATWCGPCVRELPELQKLKEMLPGNANLLGICTDGEDENELAKTMRDEFKLTYANVVANGGMLSGPLANIQSLPTTIFVDSEGNIIGEPMIGVPSGDTANKYLAAIEERLKMIGQ